MAIPDDVATPVGCGGATPARGDNVATPELWGGGDDAAPLESGGDNGSNSND